MQLKKKNRTVCQGLAVATCTLLSNVSQNVAAHDVEGKDLDYTTSFLDYVERDRVKVREIDQTISWQMNDDINLSGTFIFDSITGSTPTGALSANSAASDTSTTASGSSSGTGFGGGTSNTATFIDPLTPIVDRRVAVSGQITHELNRTSGYSAGALFSQEDDYSSVGLNGSYIMELNNKLTTLEFGTAGSYDIVSPIGGSPAPDRLTNVNDVFDLEDGEKTTIDLLISATQILNHRTVTKASLTTGVTSGYLSDPYKVVTLRNSTSGLADKYFHERRPDSRNRTSINFDISHQPFEEDVLSIGYRYFWDDWDVTSHTLDVRYRRQINNKSYYMPHFRYYSQTATDFYVPYLNADDQDPDAAGTPSGINAPEYASADSRLDEMNAYTLGIKYGIEGPLGHFRVRFEYIGQRGTVGEFTDLNARFIQLSWTINVQ